MSMKQEIETWVSALSHYDKNQYEEAIAAFQPIADTSKILFNCGVIRASVGDHQAAINFYQRAVSLDQYLAVAYFQQGVSNFLIGDFEEALANFNDTLLYLRGNKSIDYEQLGLKYKLNSCEALFNRGLCYVYLQQTETGMQDLVYAAKEKSTPIHDVIDEAIKDKAAGYTVFSISVGLVFRPNEAKVRNVRVRDYLGKARLVAATPDPELSGNRRKLSVDHWARDDRPLDSLSFAATNLVKPGLSNRSRQQSEPPMHRNLFPPTPPPELEKPTFSRPPRPSSPDRTPDAGRSRSLSRKPAKLDLGPASFSSPHIVLEEAVPTEDASMRARPRMMRSASERPAEKLPDRRIVSLDSLPEPNTGLGLGAVDQLKRQDERNKQTALEINRGLLFKNQTFPKSNRQPRPASIEEEEADSDIPDSAVTESSVNLPFSRHHGAGSTPQLWRPQRAATPTPAKENAHAHAKIKNIRLKVHYADDMRYITIVPTASIEEVMAHITKKFGVAGGLKLRTKDEDSDMITMADQEDLDTAVAMSVDEAVAQGRTAAKLEVWVSDR